MRTRAQGGADVAVVDVGYLSTSYALPESDVQTLLDAPTAELVKDFLASVTAKAQEHDALKADKLKVDVELENTVRTSEAKVKAQKTAVTRQAKENEELRTKLTAAENAREALTSELEQLRSSTSGSTSETQALRQRIDSLEASNRDALALVESKTTEKDRLATELSEQHGKLLALRRGTSQLEKKTQSLENSVSSQKFKEQSLQQEIDLLKRNSEWHANELQTRSSEHAKFRKERNARIASLQRELEDANASVDTLKRTETNLRQRLDEVQAKADEAFAKIAATEEEAARKEQGWKTELNGSKRLAELQAQNAATHKARLQEVQGQIDQIKEDAAEEIGRLQAEIETERSDKETAEGKVAELELKVERLEQQPRYSRPGTPMNGGLEPATPGRIGSPFAVAGSARKFERMTQTQYVARINELQQELAAEERRTAKLSQAMDDMINEVENRGPELVELRDEQQRLEEEVLNFSRMLDEANTNRDGAVKDAERWQGEADSGARENEILRQQLRDLSAQVKILLVEIQSRDQGLEGMSGQERFQLEQAARGELEEWSQNESFTNQLISQRLVIFRDVETLQSQNQELLRTQRILAEQLEGEEARKKAAQSTANAQEAEEMRQQVARYKDELQSTATQIDSYMKERDMFRRMLQHRGQLPPDTDIQSMFGQSLGPATPQRNGASPVPPTPRSKDVEDLNKLLREQQAFFDQYRNESSTDRKMLKEQVDTLGREKSSLQSDIAHWKSQKTLSDERLQMLQANYNGLRSENTELQRRSQQMAENAAKQDLRTQQVAEELVEARSLSDSLRNENANAKAEKELWKRIETRMTEDNKSLMDERSRLNKLVSDLQNLQNERELSDSETRRRLQGRVESLETELADNKKRLEIEVDDGRKANLRREYEEGQSRTRIDDLVKSLGLTREELVAAKATRDQLQARVDEMKIELRSAEERAAALHPRPTPRPQAQTNAEQYPNGEEEELSAEQRWALELSDLRRDLELAKNELEAARGEVEQYKGIAQTTEEELANFNETSGQYKEEADRLIAEKDASIKELQQRVDDLLAELTTTNNELSELHAKDENATRILTEQKASLDAEIARLRDDADRYSEEKKLYQEDLKAQAEIAQQAQQSYEDELLKHAEAARSLQSVRKEYNELRTEVAGVKAEAEASKASLEQGEDSWTEQKERFERELEEAKRRRADVDEQNRLLHQQMETFSTELAALKAGRAVSGSKNDGERASTPSGDGNLQDVIKYLRREKEIVDVQYELSMQEAKRLQQQLDYANGQLEDSRQKLVEERRQSAEKTASEGSTTKLMQTINELNLYRESSTTLRAEAQQARERLSEKSNEVERLLAEIEPLKGKVGELEGELEGKVGEVKLLQDDRDHWRERTQNIISKYDRVDPAELEEMKSQLESLRAEKERLESEQQPLREQLENAEQVKSEAVEENTKLYTGRLENFKNQAKEQNRKQVARIGEANAALEAANAEKSTAQEELVSLRKELEEAKGKLAEAEAKPASAPAQNEEGEVSEGNNEADHAELHAKIAAAEGEASEHSARAGELQSKVAELEGTISTLQTQLDNALQGEGEDGEIREAAPPAEADSEALEKLKQEVETLRANAASAASAQDTGDAQPAEDQKSIADQVADEVAKQQAELEAQHELALMQAEEQNTNRLDSMKKKLNDLLKAEKAKTAELQEQHAAEIQKLNDDHDSVIAKLKEEHAAELEKFSRDGNVAIVKAESAQSNTRQPASTVSSTASVNSAADGMPEVSDEQMMALMKTHPRAKVIMNNNINKRVESQTAPLNQTIKEKDEEIATLKAALEAAEAKQAAPAAEAGVDEALKKEVEELKAKLAAAEKERQAAVQQATATADKKATLQANMLRNVQVKLEVVRKAAQETPEKVVKDVWDVANATKAPPPGPPKPATPAKAAEVAAPAPAPASPAATAQKIDASAATPAATAAITQPTQTQEPTEADKIAHRQARFGTSGIQAPRAVSGSGSFGQPCAAGATPSTFGQPSNPAGAGGAGGMAAPARRASMNVGGMNAGAQAFTPGGQNRGGAGGGIPRGNFSGAGARGGGSGIPRGGPAGGASGARGGPGRGAGNAGQKRAHGGEEGGGDAKRSRGGGGGAGSGGGA